MTHPTIAVRALAASVAVTALLVATSLRPETRSPPTPSPAEVSGPMVEGAAWVPFSGHDANAATHSQALREARLDALEGYVRNERDLAGPYPHAELRLFLDHKVQIGRSIDSIIGETIPVEQFTDQRRHLYFLRIRARVNPHGYEAAIAGFLPQSRDRRPATSDQTR